MITNDPHGGVRVFAPSRQAIQAWPIREHQPSLPYEQWISSYW